MNRSRTSPHESGLSREEAAALEAAEDRRFGGPAILPAQNRSQDDSAWSPTAQFLLARMNQIRGLSPDFRDDWYV